MMKMFFAFTNQLLSDIQINTEFVNIHNRPNHKSNVCLPPLSKGLHSR